MLVLNISDVGSLEILNDKEGPGGTSPDETSVGENASKARAHALAWFAELVGPMRTPLGVLFAPDFILHVRALTMSLSSKIRSGRVSRTMIFARDNLESPPREFGTESLLKLTEELLQDFSLKS